MKPLWQTPAFQKIAGKTLRPGGLSTTREALSWLLSHNLLPTGLAVDGGTGYGESLGLLQSLGFLCLGLDTNTASLPHLLAKNCYAAQADISHLPLAEQSTAIILLECVLSLLADPKTALAEAHRILSPAGIALVSDLTVEGTPSCSTSSCLAGARSRAEWEALFTANHFRLLAFFDHTKALISLAARLVWYTNTRILDTCHTHYGYAVWLLQKENA